MQNKTRWTEKVQAWNAADATPSDDAALRPIEEMFWLEKMR